MAATNAKVGFGVRLVRGTSTDIGEIIELSGPSFSRDAVDASHSLSPSGFREFIGGMIDGGEVSATVALVPSATEGQPHKELFDDLKASTATAYRLIFPDAVTYWSFSAVVTALDHSTPIDDRMTLSVTFKITGEPTLASL